jgi:DNA-binding transcriptional ArsR family regulator
MRDGAPGDVRQIDDARALAALGNPDRLRLMDALAVHGPSTTSALAGALGIATGSMSHHLKVLTEVGLVERAPEAAADRRERRWKLVTRGMRFSPGMFRDRPSAEAAASAAEGVMLDRDYESARAFLAAAEWPWDDAAFAGRTWLRLTPAELEQLGEELNDVLLRWRRRDVPDDGAPDRRVVLAFAHAFPSDP